MSWACSFCRERAEWAVAQRAGWPRPVCPPCLVLLGHLDIRDALVVRPITAIEEMRLECSVPDAIAVFGQ